MLTKQEKSKNKRKSIVKSDDFEKAFSRLEKISERARVFYMKQNNDNRKVQESHSR